jgi:hypothetical protein
MTQIGMICVATARDRRWVVLMGGRMSATTPVDRHGRPAQYRQGRDDVRPVACGDPAELDSAEELLTRQSVPSERESSGGPLLSGVDRSTGPAVKAQRLHDGERCGGDEHLDVRGGQHTVYFAMMGAAAFGDGVEVGPASGPGVLPVPGAQLVQVIDDQDRRTLRARTASCRPWPGR